MSGSVNHQMLPGAVGQTVVLHGDPLVGGLLPQEGQARQWQVLPGI